MANTEKLHVGHRQRLKNRFLAEGLEHFDEHQVLELLLFYTVPRQDTNPIAHALLDHFGSLTQVMEASPAELLKVAGIGESSATFLSLLNAFCRYYLNSVNASVKVLNTLDACGEYLKPFFFGCPNEMVYLLCLDGGCKVLSCKKVGEGSVNSAAVPIRKIVEMAIASNATSAILAHNHPSGIAIPSAEDELTTRQLALALSLVGVELTDHIVIANNDFVSLHQSGRYDPRDCRVLI